MQKHKLLDGAILGVLTALVVELISYLASQIAGMPRFSFVIFDWIARMLPGNLITLGIDAMVKIISQLNIGPTSAIAKRVEQGTGMAIFLLLGMVFGIVLAAVGRDNPHRLSDYGMLGGLILTVPVVGILLSLPAERAHILADILYVLVVFILWGWVLGGLIQAAQYKEVEREGVLSRRGFLRLTGIGSLVVFLSALGISLVPDAPAQESTGGGTAASDLANASTTSGPAQSPPKAVLDARIPPAPGTRPELTDNKNFYRIDINTMPVVINGDSWRLELSGLVDKPLSLSLQELRSFPSFSQAITLECISNQLGGDLTSSSVWTGARLKDVLDKAGLAQNAQAVYVESADGFYETVVMTDAMDERTLLVYEMNGQPLPAAHGFPLRIYIPNRFGMKQPKWITRMQVIANQKNGYWVDRGWDREAIPPTTSVIDNVAVDAPDPQTGAVPLGGIAYAGARGISKVEVQVDDGPWEQAELRDPALSPLTWVQWRYLWQGQHGEHTFKVRAYDGSGELQVTQSADPHPSGATGVFSMRAFIPAA